MSRGPRGGRPTALRGRGGGRRGSSGSLGVRRSVARRLLRPALERPAHLPKTQLVAATGLEGARHAGATVSVDADREPVNEAAAPARELVELVGRIRLNPARVA